MNKKIQKAITILLILALLLFTGGCAPSSTLIEASDLQDVSPEDWFYRYVVQGLHFGLVTYTNENGLYFEPDRDVTLTEFVTMLGRVHEFSGETIRASYLEWASETGIIGGEGLRNLDPYGPITREQMATIVDRYISGFELEEYFLWNLFAGLFFPPVDYGGIARWAAAAAINLRDYGLIAGDFMSDSWEFKPQTIVSRADALAVVVRMCRTLYGLPY